MNSQAAYPTQHSMMRMDPGLSRYCGDLQRRTIVGRVPRPYIEAGRCVSCSDGRLGYHLRQAVRFVPALESGLAHPPAQASVCRVFWAAAIEERLRMV
jgi:hypothetical protein